MIAHVAADGSIKAIHAKLSPFIKVLDGERFVSADPPAYDEAVRRYVEGEIEAGREGPDVVFLDATRPLDELVTIVREIVLRSLEAAKK